MSKLTVVALGTALMLVSAAAAADTYRWVDAEGNVHYGDRPVRGSQEVDVRVAGEAPKPAPLPVAENEEEFSEEDFESEGDVEGVDDAEAAPGGDAESSGQDADQVRAELCEQAKARLQRYESADGLYEEGPDGQKRELTVDERVDTILNARQSVKNLCDSPAG